MPADDPRRSLQSLSTAIAAAVGRATAAGISAAVEINEALPLRTSDGHDDSESDRTEPDRPTLHLPQIPLVVKAVVEPIGMSSDGAIVTTVLPAWRAIIDALARDPEALRLLSPRQVEELVAASYEQAGFDEVILTPRSGDFGRDVIATMRGFCTVRIIDQVKHYAPDHRVAADDVRALLGVLLSDERATKGLVTTTSTFAPGISVDPFIAKHVPYRLELVDGPTLLERLTTGTAPRR